MTAFEQDQNDKLWYDLAVLGDTVGSAQWTVTAPAGATYELGTPANFTEGADVAGSKVLFGKVSVEGLYTLTCTIAGGSGAQYERSARIAFKQL